MKVVAHQPCRWFLLQNQNDYIFNTSVEFHCVSYDVSIFLTDEELVSYHSLGEIFLDDLAIKLEQATSISRYRDMNNPYLSRILHDKTLDKEITKTVVDWRKQNS